VLLRTSSLAHADDLRALVEAAGRPELSRTACRWWKEIEVLVVTGATTGKVEANNTGIKPIKTHRPRLLETRAITKSVILMRSAVRTAA
jgi:hypothetical protein